jgi:hypothetical protein
MSDKFQKGDLVTLGTDPRRRGVITGSTKMNASGKRKFWQIRMLIWPSNSDPYFNWEESGISRTTFEPENSLMLVVGEKYEEPQTRYYRNRNVNNQEDKMSKNAFESLRGSIVAHNCKEAASKLRQHAKQLIHDYFRKVLMTKKPVGYHHFVYETDDKIDKSEVAEKFIFFMEDVMQEQLEKYEEEGFDATSTIAD